MTFTPTPFATPVLSALTQTHDRANVYLSIGDYRFEPTAVGTRGLVAGSDQQGIDTDAALSQLIEEASQVMDDHCFHGSGSLVSTVVQEQDTITPKADGSLVLICNRRPIRQVVGIGVGAVVSQLGNISPQAAANLEVKTKTITVPGGFFLNPATGDSIPVFPGGWPTANGTVIAVWSYISGYPHTSLAASVNAGVSSISVNPSSPSGVTMDGVYAGTALTIKDGAQTERVVVQTTPTGSTLALTAPLRYAHNLPPAPGAIMVSGLPQSIVRACVATVSFLTKTRGNRAQVPAAIGSASPAQKQAMGRSGALGDYELACRLLKPYTAVYLHA